MNDNSATINNETIDIFIPLLIKKRGGTAMVVIAKNIDLTSDQKYFDEKMIKAIARAYKWKIMLDKQKVSSLAEIAEKENLTSSYVSRIFNLNFLSPKIVEKVLNGMQPRTLRLQDIITNKMPDIWHEQEEMWGFLKY